jgi:heme/copper-type cytochrome/quinol oxidase subunit 3
MAASVPASHAGLTDAPPPPLARPRVVMVAAALVSVACAVFFAGMIGIYLTLRSAALAQNQAWLPEASVFPLQQPNVMLFALIMSSVTVQWAVDAIRRDDRQQAYLALGITLLFGFAVANMAAYLYSVLKLDISIVKPVATPMPVLVYTITGAHLLMLVAAMVFVGLMAFRALGGQFTSRQYDGVSAAALFWHAQVVVFVVIWFAIYITK